MKAMVYRRYGGPEVLELAELPEPKTLRLPKTTSALLNPGLARIVGS